MRVFGEIIQKFLFHEVNEVRLIFWYLELTLKNYNVKPHLYNLKNFEGQFRSK